MKRFSLFLITGLLLMGFGLSLKTDVPTTRAAFGTSPPWIRNDHLLPGSTFEQVVNLSRNNPDRDMQVTFRVDGDEEIEKWLNIEDEKNLVMKAGQKVLPVKFIVKVPRRAALKDYLALRRTLLKGPDRGALFLGRRGKRMDACPFQQWLRKHAAEVLDEVGVAREVVLEDLLQGAGVLDVPRQTAGGSLRR